MYCKKERKQFLDLPFWLRHLKNKTCLTYNVLLQNCILRTKHMFWVGGKIKLRLYQMTLIPLEIIKLYSYCLNRTIGARSLHLLKIERSIWRAKTSLRTSARAKRTNKKYTFVNMCLPLSNSYLVLLYCC